MQNFKHFMKRFLRFFRTYKQFGLVIAASLISLVLDLNGIDTPAHWLLGLVGIAVTALLLWDAINSLRSGSYGIDIG